MQSQNQDQDRTTRSLNVRIAQLASYASDLADDLKTIKAVRIEALTQSGVITGKNAEERERAALIALATDQIYQTALKHERETRSQLATLRAELDDWSNGRRDYEWSIRAETNDLLRRRFPAAQIDQYGAGTTTLLDAMTDDAKVVMVASLLHLMSDESLVDELNARDLERRQQSGPDEQELDDDVNDRINPDDGMSHGDLNSTHYAGKRRPTATYSMLAREANDQEQDDDLPW